jgi:hypothetical protein
VLQRAPHHVERALELSDLSRSRLGHPRREVAAGETTGHARCAAYGLNDRPRQVSRVKRDQHDRADDSGNGRGRCSICGGVGAAFRAGVGAMLDRNQLVEVGAHRVNPLLPLLGGADGPRGPVASSGRVHERHRVLAHVVALPARDSCGLLFGGGLALDEREHPGSPLREHDPRPVPRLEKSILAGDDEPSLPGLEVEQQALELVGRDQHVLRVAAPPLGTAYVPDGKQQHHEGAADDQRKQRARPDHPSGQSARRLGFRSALDRGWIASSRGAAQTPHPAHTDEASR